MVVTVGEVAIESDGGVRAIFTPNRFRDWRIIIHGRCSAGRAVCTSIQAGHGLDIIMT